MFSMYSRIRPYTRLPLAIARRWAHCIGCGSDLVPAVSRTRAPPQAPNRGAAAAQAQSTSALVAEMSAAQRDALNWDGAAMGAGGDASVLAKHGLRHERQATRSAQARKSQLCKPCVMSRAGTLTELYVPAPAPPVLGRRFHVIDALDFPLGVPFGELADAASSDVFVVNRCDLIVPRQSQLAQFKRYVMQAVFGPHGVREDRVHTVSAKHAWNLKKLSEAFVSPPKANYFVGAPNAGKTALVHRLAGVGDVSGATAWPVPFTTQHPTEFRAQPQFRSKDLIDMPSAAGAGLAPFDLLPPGVLRKTGAGSQVMHRDAKYLAMPIRARSGQTVSIGGLLGLEFPRLPAKQLPIHVFPVINGMNHTNFGQAFHSPETLARVNASEDANHATMRMHTARGLALAPVAEFAPVRDGVRQSLAVKGLGFLQPFLFGPFPADYAAIVHAAPGIDVMARPEFVLK